MKGENGHHYLSLIDDVKKTKVDPFTNKSHESEFRNPFIHVTIGRQKNTWVVLKNPISMIISL